MEINGKNTKQGTRSRNGVCIDVTVHLKRFRFVCIYSGYTSDVVWRLSNKNRQSGQPNANTNADVEAKHPLVI